MELPAFLKNDVQTNAEHANAQEPKSRTIRKVAFVLGIACVLLGLNGLHQEIIVFLLFVGAHGAAVWIGTRVRWPVLAFFLAWATTPIASWGAVMVSLLAFNVITPSNNGGSWVLIVPFYGFGTGLVAGIIAAVMVDRRRRNLKTGDSIQSESEH